MQPNPISSLLRSRKFLVAMLDAFIGSLSLALTWFLSPDKVASVLTIYGLWQPVVMFVIGAIAAEDVANAKVGAELYKADKSLAEAKIYQDMPVVNLQPLPPLATADLERVKLAIDEAVKVECDEKPQG